MRAAAKRGIGVQGGADPVHPTGTWAGGGESSGER